MTIVTEETPLLLGHDVPANDILNPSQHSALNSSHQGPNSSSDDIGVIEEALLPKHNDIYDKFSRTEKGRIVAIVAVGGTLPLTVGWSFIPSIPQIAKDLDSTPSMIYLGVSISIFASALGAIVGATYSGFYGRRPVYLFCLPILFLGSTGVALARSVPELIIWRFFQAMGAAPGGSVGAGSIGDIYRLEERGRGMSVYFAACLIGLVLAPLIGGFVAHYASWRLMQLALGIMGLGMWFFVILYLPETSHPGTRGIEKVVDKEKLPRWRPIILNPLKPLALLRSPVLMNVALVTACSLFTYQVVLIPLAYTLAARYGITNEVLIGACFFAAGSGNVVGTPLIGYISDMTVIHWRKKRNGVWVPEDRLRPALLPLLIIIPVSCFLSGLLSTYGVGTWGLVLDLLCLFINGVGLEMVWGPCAAFLVDVTHSQSAESIAANTALRAALVSFGVSSILPMINRFGVVVANGIGSGVSLVGWLLLWCTIRYGKPLREWVDVGFSTAETN